MQVLEERRPLLSPSPSESPSTRTLVSKHPPSIRGELTHLVGKSSPLVVGFMLESAIGLTSIAIAGRLGATELGIVGNGYMLAMVTAAVVALSATSIQVTLSSPLFTSPDHPRTDIGVIAQRTFILANLGVLPVYALWWKIEPVMNALGQPKSLSEGLTPFLRVMMLGQPGFILMEVCKSYLQVQAMMAPSTIIIAVIIPFHIALCYALTHLTSLGIIGTALAICITTWTFGLALLVYIWRSAASQCWDGLSRRALEGWFPFVRMWVPALFMFATEWWAFEVTALFAGRLGEVPVAAQAGLSSLDGALTIIPYAISLCSTARIGNLMGYGLESIPRLKAHVRASILLQLGVTTTVATILLASRGKLGRIFTDDQETRELIRRTLLPMATYQLFDGMQGVGAGILRATGRQDLAAVIHIIAYYAVGLPVGYWLAFKYGLGLEGLWAGQAVALLLVAATELSFYFCAMRWIKEIKRAGDRGEEHS